MLKEISSLRERVEMVERVDMKFYEVVAYLRNYNILYFFSSGTYYEALKMAQETKNYTLTN